MKRFSRTVLLAVCLGGAAAAAQDTPRPVTGRWEGEIANPTRPIVVMVDFDRLVASFSGADSTPVASLRMQANDVEFEIPGGARTFRFSGRYRTNAISGTVTGFTRTLGFSLIRLREPKADATRVEAWREDLDQVDTRFLHYDRSFSAAARAQARSRLARLRDSIETHTDQQMLVELSRIIALADNAHTRAYFVRNRTEVRRLPIRVWWFQNELRIVRAAAAGLLGCRIVRIANVDTDTAFRRVRDIKAGNPSWQRYMSTYFLTSGDVLAGAGVVSNADAVPVAVNCDGAVRQTTLTSLPLRRSTTAVEAWWDLAPAHPAADPGFATVLNLERTPRYLRRTHENYWFEYIPELEALYIQYNRSQPSPAEPMSDFVGRVAAALAQRAARALVVDVRFNTGGDLGTGTPLVERIAPLMKPTAIFVLTGRSTFSAGISHTVQWKQRGATVVGEPVGDELDTWSEGGNLELPHSRLTLHYANGFHRYSTRDYPENRPYFQEFSVRSVEPDVRVEPSWDDYLSGRDPLLEAVGRRMKR